MTNNSGFIYVAFGVEYLLMAVHSARTLKKFHPDAKVQVITNIPIETVEVDERQLFDIVEIIEEKQSLNRKIKISLDKYCAFDKVVFLDCDTEILQDLTPLFDILEYFPFALKFNSYYVPRKIDILGRPSDYYGLSDWNSGVIAFDVTAPYTIKLFELWRENYKKLGYVQDQPSLRKSIYEIGSLPLPLSGEWNAKNTPLAEGELIKNDQQSVKIYHYRDPVEDQNVRERYQATLNILYLELKDKINNKEKSEIYQTINQIKIDIQKGCDNHKKKYRDKRSEKEISILGRVKKNSFKSVRRIFNLLGFDLKKL